MSKRTRRTSSLRPGTSELERHQGASTLLFGSAAAALSPVDQPGSAEVAGSHVPLVAEPFGSGDGGQPDRLRPSTSVADLTIPDAVIVPSRVEVEAHSSAPESLAQPATPESSDASDLIRPLTLAPSEGAQPLTKLETRTSQPSDQAPNAVSTGADSSAPTIAAATPVIPTPNEFFPPEKNTLGVYIG